MRNIALTILIVLAVVFGIQNMHPVDLVFLVWSIKTVTALAIVVALIIGILIGLLLSLPALLRSRGVAKESKRHATELESVLRSQHVAAAQKQADSPSQNDTN